MNKPLLLIVCLVVAALITGSAFAAEKIKIKMITGDVVTVDATVKTLTVKGKKAEVVISVDDKTAVKIDKEKKSLADVNVGDRVTVKYAETEGKTIARSIEIKTPKTGKKGVEPAKQTDPVKQAPKSGY
ncbi:MAG: TOBE domain-containing protein [Nitrospirae bacterium]|nr:TOBE domain-containing protein [Nitrospirota bacterium]